MKSEMRAKILVAAVALPMSVLTAYAVPTASLHRKLLRNRRHGDAVSGLFTELGKFDPSALRQLPSGRRPPAPG